MEFETMNASCPEPRYRSEPKRQPPFAAARLVVYLAAAALFIDLVIK